MSRGIVELGIILFNGTGKNQKLCGNDNNPLMASLSSTYLILNTSTCSTALPLTGFSRKKSVALSKIMVSFQKF
jgi:hypothetical protein